MSELYLIGDQDSVNPYFPLPSAQELNVIDLSEIRPSVLKEDLGVILSRGIVPAADNAGYVYSFGESIGCDFVALLGGDNNKMYIGPTSKSGVNRQGVIAAEGATMLTDQEGAGVISSLIIDAKKNPWLADDLGAVQTAGGLAVASFGIDAIRFEITDIDKEGIITTKRIYCWD